mmetsp:Transcript_3894/g.7157  ORF Transcript_3894/g.7157 Transcript_3894/m.7157 type:complete len:201 (-) Transcript_3894:43-645(-)
MLLDHFRHEDKHENDQSQDKDHEGGDEVERVWKVSHHGNNGDPRQKRLQNGRQGKSNKSCFRKVRINVPGTKGLPACQAQRHKVNRHQKNYVWLDLVRSAPARCSNHAIPVIGALQFKSGVSKRIHYCPASQDNKVTPQKYHERSHDIFGLYLNHFSVCLRFVKDLIDAPGFGKEGGKYEGKSGKGQPGNTHTNRHTVRL